MKLTNYRFGYVEAGDRSHRNDLIVMNDWILDNWWRNDGHSLVLDDLQDLLKRDPETIVVGSGAHGRMQIPESTRSELEERGIELEVHQTDRAIKEYNRKQEKSDRVAGAFHLNC